MSEQEMIKKLGELTSEVEKLKANKKSLAERNMQAEKENDDLRKQIEQLKEQNKHLNMVILSVCSKSVRDRKDQEEKREKATERDTPEKETPESSV